MSDVLLVTCSEFPEGEPGGGILVKELAERGVSATWVAWDDTGVDWGAARLVAVRSAWDYPRRGTRRTHPGRPADDELASAVASFGRAVVKPRVGANGRGVVVLDGPGAAGELDGSVLPPGPWVVQPLVESVFTLGETSVFVLGGAVASGVRKLPGPGETRVNEAYGGRSEQVPVTEEAAMLARRTVLAAERLLGVSLPYARIDLMRLGDGSLAVGDIEVTEPGLYLDVVPGNAKPYSDMIAALVRDRWS